MTISNVINLLFGILFGIIVSAIIAVFVLQHLMKKINKTEEIRNISLETYKKVFDDPSSKGAISGIIYEVQQVSSLTCPDSKHPLFELSINEILDGLRLLNNKLKYVKDNPLVSFLKYRNVSDILYYERNVKKAADIINKNRFVKFYKQVWNVLRWFLNFINPIFYIKLFINTFLMKKGKKSAMIITFDFVGNIVYEIYDVNSNFKKEIPINETNN